MPKTKSQSQNHDRGGRPGQWLSGHTPLDTELLKRNLRLTWYKAQGLSISEIADIEELPRSTASEAIKAGKSFLAARTGRLIPLSARP